MGLLKHHNILILLLILYKLKKDVFPLVIVLWITYFGVEINWLSFILNRDRAAYE